MALTGGMSCMKYLLFCFNALFAITGLIILITGMTGEVKAYPYSNLTDENFFKLAPVVLIGIGVIVFIVAFFGCCGTVKENHCMIITFSAFLLIIFAAELGVGIAGYFKRDNLETSIARRLNETIKNYNTDSITKDTFDILQTDMQCCGVNGPADWPNNNLTYPDTCCSGQEIQDNKPVACTTDSPHFHKDACLPILVAFMKKIAHKLGGVGLAIAFIQLLGVMVACCLARSIRRQYEKV